MHRLFMTYAVHFNEKYERTGHLFQGRFRSEPILSERGVLINLWYLHNELA